MFFEHYILRLGMFKTWEKLALYGSVSGCVKQSLVFQKMFTTYARRGQAGGQDPRAKMFIGT